MTKKPTTANWQAPKAEDQPKANANPVEVDVQFKVFSEDTWGNSNVAEIIAGLLANSGLKVTKVNSAVFRVTGKI